MSKAIHPDRLRALRAGKTIDFPNRGWRKNGFYDLDAGRETLRVFCVDVDGDNALIRLAEKKERYPKASYAQSNYTTVSALGLKGAGAALTKAEQDEISREGRERDKERRLPLYEELRRIEDHLRPQQRAELRRRIEGFKRATHEKAA